jgi:lipoprotein
MKTTITLIAAMLLLVMVGCTEQPPKDARYPFKSAIIKKITGGETENTIYIDDYGAKETIETILADPMTTSIHALRIRLPGGEFAILVNLLNKTANLISSDEMYTYYGITFKDAEDLENYKEIGEEEVAGKPCKVYLNMTPDIVGDENTVKIWNNIVMEDFTISGEQTFGSCITSIELNVPIPPEKFEIPKGIKIKESPNE